MNNWMFGADKGEVKMSLQTYESLRKCLEIAENGEREARERLEAFIDYILENAYDDVGRATGVLDLIISTSSVKEYLKEHFPSKYQTEIRRREELRKQKEEQNG